MHRLGRTREAVDAAYRLMARLEGDPRFGQEGKMFGVLLGESPDGALVELFAFSGMADGQPFADHFVGPTRPLHVTARAERATLIALEEIRDELASLDLEGLRSELGRRREEFEVRLAPLRIAHREQRAARARERATLDAAGERDGPRWQILDDLSRRARSERRALRRAQRQTLEPLERHLAEQTARRDRLRGARRELSRALQTAMHAAHGLVNFAGRWALLEDLFPNTTGVPTGTGECCAPKLLQEAALRGIRPTGLAEFWWGPPPAAGHRQHQRFYPPCQEKCAPLLGHLLCGSTAPRPPLSILFEDEDLVAIDKPAELLSVPGRTFRRADSVETRLGLLRPRASFLRAAHRLDEPTSGVLLLARNPDAHRALGAAFAAGDVHKEYRARVLGSIPEDRGEICLPLRPDPEHRPRQIVCSRSGRPATTRFRVVRRHRSWTDLELVPLTGRTHQLRVHCAAPAGLGAPILGDRLYGGASADERLFLHAYRIRLPHPTTGATLEIEAPLPADWNPLP